MGGGGQANYQLFCLLFSTGVQPITKDVYVNFLQCRNLKALPVEEGGGGQGGQAGKPS